MAKVAFTNESKRLASLREYQILDTEPDPIFDNITRQAAAICEAPVAVISSIDADRIWFKSVVGLDIREIPRSQAICPLCLKDGKLLIISDTLADERTQHLSPNECNWKIRFYAGVPLINSDGHVLGTLCVTDNRPRELSDLQIVSLQTLGNLAIHTLELHRQVASLKIGKRAEKLAVEAIEIDRIYRSAIEAMPQAAILLSNRGVTCNSKVEPILGRYAEEVQTYFLLEPCWQAISEDNTPLTIDTHPAWITLMTGKPLTQVVVGIPKPNGKLNWVKLDTSPLCLKHPTPDRKGEIAMTSGVDAVLCSLTEIAAPKPVAYCDRELLSLPSDLLGIFSKDGYLKQLLNPAWEINLGYESEELLSQPAIEFVHPEDRSPILQEFSQTADTKTPRNFLSRWLCRDGSCKWIFWHLVPIPDTDLLYATGRDATESRLLQTSIQELNNINLALELAAIVIIFGVDGTIERVNQKLCQLSLFASDELIGKPISVLDSGEHDEAFFQQIWSKLERAEIWKGEIKYKSKDGKYFWVDLTIVPLSDRQGKSINYIAIGNDITDKKQLEKQFLHAQRLESIGTMAGGISHDLNNILTPILAASQLLQMKFPEADSRTKQLLKTIEINSKRGAALVKQVLLFARGLEGVKVILTVKHIITEIHQIISQTFPKNIEIVAEIPTDLWMILGDATQIYQVLMNLAVNARDALIDGGILTITAENVILDLEDTRLNLDAKVGPYVAISLMDTGMGISSEIIDRIFDPFFTTKDLGHGTGLGLATVLTIIKGHSGFIKVDSKLGKGSLFKIYLPATIGTDERAIVEPRLPLGKGELILIVDDENLIIETTKTTLETYNYRVLVANDGIDAIALYAQRKHDINAVILDLMMPMMDGSQTVRVLRRLNPLVKIITTSGLESNSPPYNLNLTEAFLPKPYAPRDLLETLSKVLHNNRSSHSL